MTFQWIENKYREIGWFILDPERTNWPPLMLRRETNEQLINKVTILYCELVDKFNLPGGKEKKEDFLKLKDVFHDLRRFRNGLLHSTFVELKAGGDIVGLLRSVPKVSVDPDTGDLIYDQELFNQEKIHHKLGQVVEAAFRLGQHYIQLIHWQPFDQFGLKA